MESRWVNEYSDQNDGNNSVNEDEKNQAILRVQNYFKTCEYTVEQLNASRVVEHKRYNGSEPGKGCELYVKNIPPLVFEDVLLPLFNSEGFVYRMRLMMCFSGVNKGFGYVQYLTPEQASQAVKKFNRYEILPKIFLKVVKSEDNCRLFFGNIPKVVPRVTIENEFIRLLEDYSPTNIFVYADPDNRRFNRGFVFVEFRTHRHTAIARRTFANGLILWGNSIRVDWAAAERDVNDEILPGLTDLFLRCLPEDISEFDIRYAIRRAVPNVGKFKLRVIRDFAFIHFESHDVAKEVLLALQGIKIKNNNVNVMWANPEKARESDIFKFTKNVVKELPDDTKSLEIYNQQATFTSFDYPNASSTAQPASSSSSVTTIACMNFVTQPQNINDRFLVNSSMMPLGIQPGPSALSTFQGQPLWPSYEPAPVYPNTMYSLARQCIELHHFCYYDALVYFAKQNEWGDITCTVTEKNRNGLLQYEAKILTSGGIMASQINSSSPFVALSEAAARNVAAYYVWDKFFPGFHPFFPVPLTY